MKQSMTKEIATYGCWPSTITSALVTQGLCHLNDPQLDGDCCYWLESRSEEKGRGVIMRQTKTGDTAEVTPKNVSVRTRIHEYGGGAYRVYKDSVFYVNDADQRIYQLAIGSSDEPLALTPEGDYRYADFCVDETREQLICVCEIHKTDQREPENCIVAVKLDGSSTTAFNVLVFGNDFYSNPRVSPDGGLLSWLTWNHPNMPWDNSECWIAEFSQLGLLSKHRKVAGGAADGSRNESVFQPQWSPTGELFFVSDRNLWWNLYHYDIQTKTIEPVLKMDAEFATPQWVFGMSTYGFLNSFTLFCCYTQNGRWQAGLIDTMTNHFTPLELNFTRLEAIACNDETDTAVFISASDDSLDSVVQWHNHSLKIIKTSGDLALDPAEFSLPETVEFKNTYKQTVQGFFYPPHNQHYRGQADSLPPLLVVCHGGPTGATGSLVTDASQSVKASERS